MTLNVRLQMLSWVVATTVIVMGASPGNEMADAVEVEGAQVDTSAPGELGLVSGGVALRVEQGTVTFDADHGEVTFSTQTSDAEVIGDAIRSSGRADNASILEEWFLPMARGVEHLLVVDAAPNATTEFSVDVSGAKARLDSEKVVALVDEKGRTQLLYSGLEVWDAFHRPQTAWFNVSSSGFSIVIEADEYAIGPFTIDPVVGAPQTRNGLTSGEDFGQGIGVGDIDGDGVEDLAVGATGALPANRGAIRVYLGVLNTGLPVNPNFSIELPTASSGDDCGDAVEIGDVNRDTFGDIVYSCRAFGANGAIMVHLGPSPSLSVPNFILTTPECETSASRGGLILADVAGTDAKEVVSSCKPPFQNSRMVVWNVDLNGQGQSIANFELPDITSVFGPKFARVKLQPTSAFDSIAVVGAVATVRVFVGGQGSGLSLLNTIPFTLPTSASDEHTVAAGDFDFDGDDDLIIGDEKAFSNAGRVYTFVNNVNTAGSFTQDFSRTISGSAGERLGMSLGAADLNKDNFADATICRPGIAGTSAGSCRTFRGGPGGVDPVNPPSNIAGTLNLGDTPETSAGDFRGDGGRDLVIPEILAGDGAVIIQNFTPATLKSTNEIAPESNLSFGGFSGAVALGDLNNDGFDDVAVGGGNALSGQGVVLVYFGGPSADNQVDWCTAGSLAGDEFGTAVAIARVRNTAVKSLIVGAPGFDNDRGRVDVFHAPLSGGCNLSAFTPNQNFGGLIDNGRYGSAVANAGTALASGGGEAVIVGAPGDATSLIGRVEVLPSANSSLGLARSSPPIEFLGSNPAINCATFGSSVANAGNVEGTNFRDDLLVGARSCSAGSIQNGKAFLLRSNGSSPALSLSTWSFAGAASGDELGVVAGLGDVSNDGISDFAVGAPFEENGSVNNAGRVRVFRGSSTGTPSTTQAISISTTASGACGSAIVGRIDFNRDGRLDLAIGEPTNSNGASNGGRVRVFFGNLTGLIDATPEVTINGSVTNGNFGTGLAVGDIRSDTYGDVAIVEPGFTNPTNREGRVIVRSGEW